MVSVITNHIKTAQDSISGQVEYWGKESSDLLSDIMNKFSNLLSDYVVGQFSFNCPIAVDSVITLSSLSSLIHSHQALPPVPSASEQIQSYMISSEVKMIKHMWCE